MSEKFIGGPKRDEGYSPVQVRTGIVEPVNDNFPPYNQRITQHEPDLTKSIEEYKPMRVTLQSSDVCQLKCQGCYVSDWVHPDGAIKLQHPSSDMKDGLLTANVEALGDTIQDVYYLGVEPTLRPDALREAASVADKIGATVMSITNGASPIHAYERAFRGLLEDEKNPLYKVLLSLDSVDEGINNRLRGKSFAYERTMKTISHAVEQGDPVKVNITVWPDNFHTVLDTVEKLMHMGVRGFGFHCGSMEGVAPNAKLDHLDPLAWRALCAKLMQFRDSNLDKLDNFTLPYIFFTEHELREGIIGDEDGYRLYKDHLENVNKGDTSPSPVKVCPSLDIPQVYVFGLDGKYGSGALSLCNIHTVGANRANGEGYFAHFNPESAMYETEPDAEKNELQRMYNSPSLCPARPYALGDQQVNDQFATEAGDVYHACRYVSANQLPNPEADFGNEFYDEYTAFYKAWSDKIGQNPDSIDDLKQIRSTSASLRAKTRMVEAL